MVKSDWDKEGLIDPATFRGKALSELSEREAQQIGLIKADDLGRNRQVAGNSEISAFVTHIGLFDDRTDDAKRKGLLEFDSEFPW